MNTRPIQHIVVSSLRRTKGLSLIELMIAMTIGFIVLAAVTFIFANTSSTRNELERTSRQIENGRYAIELLTDDIRLAGFYGELNVGTLPTAASLPDPCSTALTDWTAAMPLHLQGYDGGAAAPACLGGSLKAGSDVLVVRRARTCAAGQSGCPAAVAGAPYIQVSLCGTELPATPYVLGLQGTATYSLHLKDCAASAPLRQYFVHMYFVSTDNGAGQNVPTLKMRELTGSDTVETPLVEGIDYLNVIYGIDNNGDGLPDTYSADPGTPANWMNVITAELFVLARNVDVSPGYIDTKTYNLGTDTAGVPVNVGPFNDGYRRHVYTRLVRITNPAGRRDTP
jgi:type IV pilus assembly protein PilW